MDREQLMASLLIDTEDIDGVSFGDERYFDWSTATDESVNFEMGDDTEATSIEMTWADMERLQRALTLRLLQRG